MNAATSETWFDCSVLAGIHGQPRVLSKSACRWPAGIASRVTSWKRCLATKSEDTIYCPCAALRPAVHAVHCLYGCVLIVDQGLTHVDGLPCCDSHAWDVCLQIPHNEQRGLAYKPLKYCGGWRGKFSRRPIGRSSCQIWDAKLLPKK